MVTIGEIIQRVQSKITGGVQEDSLRLTHRHIYSMLVSGRETLISQKSSKKQKLSEWNYQTLPFVELEEVSEGECRALGLIGCTVLRSKYKLPRPVLNLSSNIISEVSSIDNSVVFSPTTKESARFLSGKKYTANMPRYFMLDGYIYITYLSRLKVIKITGVFVDPLEAHNFPKFCEDCDDCPDCESNQEKLFHVDNQFATVLVNFVFNELLGGQQQQQREEEPQRERRE